MHLKAKYPTLIALLTLIPLIPATLHASTLYWDTNGATAGAGATADGTWDTGTTSNWSLDSTGNSATTTFTAADDVIFSAGTDNTSALASLTSNVTANSITVEEGDVTVDGVVGATNYSVNSLTTVTVASGASLTLTTDSGSTANFSIDGTLNAQAFRGGGVMSKSGAGTANFTRLDAYFTVNAGTVNLSSTAGAKLKQANVLGGTLNLTGKSFDGTSRSIQVSGTGKLALAGGVTGDTVTISGSSNDGEINGGAGSAISFNSGTFIGDLTGDLSIAKVTTGTLTYGSGANITSTGNTTVSTGTFNLADGASMTFTIGANGVNNAILGAGTDTATNLSGTFSFNLDSADRTNGNSWLIVDVDSLAESFAGSFAINGFTEASDIWTDGTGFSFSEATGTLSYTAAIPEPSTFALLGGIVVLGAAALRRRRIG